MTGKLATRACVASKLGADAQSAGLRGDDEREGRGTYETCVRGRVARLFKRTCVVQWLQRADMRGLFLV
jgi:hypothetical protein